MKKLWIRSASLAVALALPACGDDSTNPPADTSVQDTSTTDTIADTTVEDTTPDTTVEDTTTPDTSVEDTTTPDTSVEDTTTPDTSVEDTTTPDTTVEDTTPDTTVEDTTPDTTVEDTTPDTTVEMASLADLLAPFADSTNSFTTAPAKRVEGLVVTLIKPAFGTEGGGFFVQAAAEGPAVFVEVDGDLPAEVVVGATLDLQVDQIVNDFGVVRVRAFSNLSQTATGADLTTFKTNLDDVGTADAYLALANRLISLSGDITNNGDPAGGGLQDGYRRFTFTSAGLESAALGADVQVRVPRAIVDANGLEAGCAFEILAGAMWSFRDNGADKPHMAQPSVYSADAFTAVCDSPALSGAAASSTTTVTLTFSRPLAAGTVNAAAFSIAPTLEVTAVELAPNGRSATLTTAEQTPGTEYTVTVAATVTDVLGATFGTEEDSATFTTPSNTAPKALFCFEDAAGTFQLTPTVVSGFSNVVVKRVAGGTPADPGSVGGARNWLLDSDPAVNLDPIECTAGDTTSSNPSRAITGNGWSTATDAANADADTYYSVTFNAPAGVVSVAFDGYASGTGPKKLATWISGAPGFVGTAFDIATGWTAHPMYATTGGTSASGDGLTFTIPDSTTTAYELRFYPYGASASTGTFRIDNLTLTWAPAQ